MRPLLIIDLFAGGGGASEGVRQALGAGPSVAVDLNAQVLGIHAINHPECRHIEGNVWSVNPREVTGGQNPDVLWLSPVCKEFSQAKTGRARDPKVMNLAWVAAWWAASVKPRVIMMENVKGMLKWGPLMPDGMSDPTRTGLSFKRWVARLEALGYAVAWRELNAADFGSPTERRRLFLVARCDGEAITWPDPSHGPGRKQPHVGVGTVLNLKQTGKRIDDLTRHRALGTRTLHKTAATLTRHGELAPSGNMVAIMSYQGKDGGRGVSRPLKTLMTKGSEALVQRAPDGVYYHRMLETYESAAAQGFPRDYQWGPLKTFNLMVVGNSVSPPVARSLAAAVVLNVTPIVANYLHLYRKHTSVGFRRMLLVHTAERAESVGDKREVKSIVVAEVERALASMPGFGGWLEW